MFTLAFGTYAYNNPFVSKKQKYEEQFVGCLGFFCCLATAFVADTVASVALLASA